MILPVNRTSRSQRDRNMQGDSTLGKSITKKDDSYDYCSDLSIVFDNIDGMKERIQMINDFEIKSIEAMDIQN